MRPGRAVIAVVVSAFLLGVFGWHASRYAESDEGVVQVSAAPSSYSDRYNPIEWRGGSAEMRRTVQHMISR